MKLSILFIFCFAFNSVYSQQTFAIKGQTPAHLNGARIYIVVWDTYSNNRFRRKDSTTVVNNAFFFSGTIDKPCEDAFIYTKEKHSLFYFVVDTGLNTMVIKNVEKTSFTFRNRLSNTTVENSISNSICKQIDSLTNRYYFLYSKPSSANKNILKLDSIKSNELKFSVLQVITKHPNAFYSLIKLYTLFRESRSSANSILEAYESLSDKLKFSKLGVELLQDIQFTKATEIGRVVPDFTARTQADSLFTNKSLIGQTYLLAFGATWCLPCKEDYPMLKKLYQKYRRQGFEIVDVNLDDKGIEWKDQIVRYKLSWINVSELVKWQDSKLARIFNIQTVPFYLVVNKQGNIVYNLSQLKDFNYSKLEPSILRSIK